MQYRKLQDWKTRNRACGPGNAGWNNSYSCSVVRITNRTEIPQQMQKYARKLHIYTAVYTMLQYKVYVILVTSVLNCTV